VISAVDLVKGLGLLAGLTVRAVAGATGYLGTNYAGKMAAAAQALAAEDFVYLHVEAPDETSHEGDLAKKIQAIEEFDRHIVAEALALRSVHRDLRILVAPDHATPVSTKTHASDAVPFAVCGSGVARGAVSTYSEKSSAGAMALSGEQLFEAFIRGSF
jgi:2,3-bisphosphoglycerate-independent phosphoglycerate mutase